MVGIVEVIKNPGWEKQGRLEREFKATYLYKGDRYQHTDKFFPSLAYAKKLAQKRADKGQKVLVIRYYTGLDPIGRMMRWGIYKRMTPTERKTRARRLETRY